MYPIRNETQEQKKRRFATILRRLRKQYPHATIALKYHNHIQLLVAVMLSAQCTDKKVNEVTAVLFKKYKTVRDFARAKQDVLEREIRPTGFFRAKARHVIAAAQMIERDFGGNIPKRMEEILTLPGVARKTANIVLGNAYGIVEGIAVDTHVARLAQRFGITSYEHTDKIERDLMALVPKYDWFPMTYTLIEHGRAICTARNRKCEICPVNKICPSSLIQ